MAHRLQMVTTFKGTGVSLVAVRAYGRQMLLALRCLDAPLVSHAFGFVGMFRICFYFGSFHMHVSIV